MNNFWVELADRYVKNPTEMLRQFVGGIELVKPLVYAVMMSLFDSYKDLTGNDEYFRTVAEFKHNKYLAYINVGFNEDQAMMLLLHDMNTLDKTISNGANVKINN